MKNQINLKENPQIGVNEIWGLWKKINEYVDENFNVLYEGAVRLDCHIPADYYAPRRIQINETRIHERDCLKIADGHHMKWDENPDEERIVNAVRDINLLIEAAEKEIKSTIEIVVKK